MKSLSEFPREFREIYTSSLCIYRKHYDKELY